MAPLCGGTLWQAQGVLGMVPAMKQVRVTSEVGRLRRVIIHEPGRELLAVTPSNRQEYLYDDIIDLEISRAEHGNFTAILRHFAEVLSVRTLLQETLEVPEAREF